MSFGSYLAVEEALVEVEAEEKEKNEVKDEVKEDGIKVRAKHLQGQAKSLRWEKVTRCARGTERGI